MSSGALVFVDEMTTPLPNPPLDGQHIVVYDNNDEQGESGGGDSVWEWWMTH
jgi:hypothetical protein